MPRVFSLILLALPIILMTSCSSDSPCPSPAHSWYRCGMDEQGNRLFYTNTRVSATFPETIGNWKALSTLDHKLYMTAKGNTFTIETNYGWDGATNAPTTEKLLLPTLFHDALLHAMMNGAPIPRKRADLAFYQLMKRERYPLAGTYYRAVRTFGSSFLEKQNPPTLKIIIPVSVRKYHK